MCYQIDIYDIYDICIYDIYIYIYLYIYIYTDTHRHFHFKILQISQIKPWCHKTYLILTLCCHHCVPGQFPIYKHKFTNESIETHKLKK